MAVACIQGKSCKGKVVLFYFGEGIENVRADNIPNCFLSVLCGCMTSTRMQSLITKPGSTESDSHL